MAKMIAVCTKLQESKPYLLKYLLNKPHKNIFTLIERILSETVSSFDFLAIHCNIKFIYCY
jgi:hypothetical protein